MHADRDQLTICAVSTPPGWGGISVLRLSGPQAESVIRRLAPFLPSQLESHRVYYGILRHPEQKTEIDEVLVTWFEKGRSFTGEPTAEISCHGSPQICQLILQALISSGASTAQRGEFTYRAFMNGRLDLVQAESVLSLIEAKSSMAARQALRQLQGALSQRLERIENELTWVAAHIEADIDFSTEGLQTEERNVLLMKLQNSLREVEELLRSYQTGRRLKEGLRVVLLGRPNVGKSSLLNVFSEEDRAIVTDIPGTTRDLIEAEIRYEGFTLTFVDTAGLRESQDPVEKKGIEKSHQAGLEADVVLFVYDLSQGWTAADQALFQETQKDRVFLVGNKSDLTAGKNYRDSRTPGEIPHFNVSSFDRNSLKPLLQEIQTRFLSREGESEVLLSQARHEETLRICRERIIAASELLRNGEGEEWVSLDLKEAIIRLHEILGRRFDDQIMDRVFREFCIGK